MGVAYNNRVVSEKYLVSPGINILPVWQIFFMKQKTICGYSPDSVAGPSVCEAIFSTYIIMKEISIILSFLTPLCNDVVTVILTREKSHIKVV